VRFRKGSITEKQGLEHGVHKKRKTITGKRNRRETRPERDGHKAKRKVRGVRKKKGEKRGNQNGRGAEGGMSGKKDEKAIQKRAHPSPCGEREGKRQQERDEQFTKKGRR